MNRQRRPFLQVGAAALAAPLLPRLSRAQSVAGAWPSRVIRLVVGFPPGGGADAAARILASRLSEIWGQQVVVENKPGAGGNIAHDQAAHAGPTATPCCSARARCRSCRCFLRSLSYDPMADFAPISLIGNYPNLSWCRRRRPSTRCRSTSTSAKANPGKVTYASPGIGTTPQLAAELFKKMAGIDVTHVPYRGVAAGAMTDLLANRDRQHVQHHGLAAPGGALGPGARAGAVDTAALAARAGTTNLHRSGVPGFSVTSWYGVFAPAKTPRDILTKMNDGLVQMLAEPAVKSRFEVLGVEAASSTPEQLTALMRAEIELWTPIIKASNIKAE